MPALIIRSDHVVLPDGAREAAVVVRDGRIAEVTNRDARLDGAARDIDLGDLALLPGLVDTHVHVSEPGRTEPEDFATATGAAAAGGITTICDMSLSSGPAATTVRALRAKADAAKGRCAVDVAFWGGAVPGNSGELLPLLDAGVAGLECFLADSGAPEFPPLGKAELREAMTVLAGTGAPVIVHAEDPAEVRDPAGPGYSAFLASRPPVAERRAIETVVSAAAATGARAHIAHLSAAECAALIGAAKAAGIALSAETCPHYLLFAAEEIPEDATEFTCRPPVRYAPNREALWRAVEAGVIGGVVSGHSPRSPIASLRVSLAATWTVARQRGRTLTDVARWMSAFPASLAGLAAKGAIAPGRDADLVAFDPDATFTPPGGSLPYCRRLPPHAGQALTGQVTAVWLRGQRVIPGQTPPNGQLIRRERRDFGAAGRRAMMGLPPWPMS